MPAVPTPAHGTARASQSPAAQSTTLARGALVALLDEAATRATLAAHGEIAVVVAQAPGVLARVTNTAKDAVESFATEIATTDAGRRVAAMARGELREPAEAWVMFLARPTRDDDRARTLGIAATVAALRVSARWCGLAARSLSGTQLVSSRIAALLASTSGSWFAGAELVAAVLVASTGVSATIPPIAVMPSSFAVPTLWLGDGERLEASPDDEQARAAMEIPQVIRAEPGTRALVCDPSHHREGIALALAAAGYAVDSAPPDQLRDRCARERPSLVVAQMDDATARAALEAIVSHRDGNVVPVLACSGCGHEDARLRAAHAGITAFLPLPARPFDVARKAHELVAMKQLVDAARRHTTEVGRIQAELMRSERMATLGWLAASVGHDLRTPLAAIRSNSDLALKTVTRLLDAPDATNAESARRALSALQDLERTNVQAVDRMAEIVAGLKAFARPDEAAPPSGRVDDAVDHVLVLCAQEIRGANVVREIECDLPEVAMRHAELMQVLMNLVVNAAHAVRPGGRIEIRAQKAADAVTLDVLDDGPGVPEAVRSQLFRSGFTTRAATGGTGLGLSIVKRIVDGAGGSISLEPGTASGAHFRVRLPLA